MALKIKNEINIALKIENKKATPRHKVAIMKSESNPCRLFLKLFKFMQNYHPLYSAFSQVLQKFPKNFLGIFLFLLALARLA